MKAPPDELRAFMLRSPTPSLAEAAEHFCTSVTTIHTRLRAHPDIPRRSVKYQAKHRSKRLNRPIARKRRPRNWVDLRAGANLLLQEMCVERGLSYRREALAAVLKHIRVLRRVRTGERYEVDVPVDQCVSSTRPGGRTGKTMNRVWIVVETRLCPEHGDLDCCGVTNGQKH